MAGVKPLRQKGKSVARSAPDPPRNITERRSQNEPDRFVVHYESDGTVVGHRRNTHQSVLDALEHPRLEVDATRDLHGLTAREAEREVLRFIRESHRDGDRWLLIIVGKGIHSPLGLDVLKDRVVEALSRREAARYVLAFRTAPRRLGGAGALALRLIDRL